MRASDLLQLTAPIEFFHKGSRVAPAGLDLDEEFEKDFGSYHFFDVEAGRGSDLLEHLAAFAQQDGLLAVAFAINHSRDPGQARTLFKLLDQNGDGVRHFFMGVHENVLADQLRCHESHGLVGDLVFGKIARTVGQSLEDARQQFIEALLLQGGDGDDLLEIMQSLELRDQREQLALVGEEINFVEQQEDRSAGLSCQVEDEIVVAIPLFLGVDNHQNQFAAFQRLAHLGHHFASERRTGLVNSRRVDEHDLPGLAAFLLGDVDDSENAVARGLRLGRNNGQLLADQRVQQCAFARVRAAENADESGVKGHEDRLLASGCRRPADISTPNDMNPDANSKVFPG